MEVTHTRHEAAQERRLLVRLKDVTRMDRNNLAQGYSLAHGRTYRRFKLEFPVRLKFQSHSGISEIDTVSRDLSMGGLLVRSAEAVPQCTPVSFVLSVHGVESLRPVYLTGEGEVVRVEFRNDENGYALAIRCSAPVTELKDYLPS